MDIIDLEPVVPTTGFFILSRVKNRQGNWATQSDIASISVRVVNEANELVSVNAPVVADVVSNSLQLDGRWKKDKLGYNVAYATLAAETPEPDTAYLFKIKFTPTIGAPFFEYYRVRTLAPAF
jgi:hypothetical protein